MPGLVLCYPSFVGILGTPSPTLYSLGLECFLCRRGPFHSLLRFVPSPTYLHVPVFSDVALVLEGSRDSDHRRSPSFVSPSVNLPPLVWCYETRKGTIESFVLFMVTRNELFEGDTKNMRTDEIKQKKDNIKPNNVLLALAFHQ